MSVQIVTYQNDHFGIRIPFVKQPLDECGLPAYERSSLYIPVLPTCQPFLSTERRILARRIALAGLLTDEPDLVDAAIDHFDSVWAGFKCKNCGRKEYCPNPIIR